MHTPDALLDPHRIPRQIKIDDNAAKLQILAFPARFRTDEHAAFGTKFVQSDASFFVAHPAVKSCCCNAFCAAELRKAHPDSHEIR